MEKIDDAGFPSGQHCQSVEICNQFAWDKECFSANQVVTIEQKALDSTNLLFLNDRYKESPYVAGCVWSGSS